MIPDRRTYYFLIILMFIMPWNSSAQQEQIDFFSILNKVESFDMYSQPDSIINLAEKLVPFNDRYSDNTQYQDIIVEGILAAIVNKQPDIESKLLSLIETNDLLRNNKQRYGEINHKVSLVLLDMHRHSESMHYCKTAFDNYTAVSDREGQAEVLISMYNNAYFSHEDSSNYDYLDQAITIAVEAGDSALLSEVYFTTGKAYYRSSDFENAILHYKLAREYTPKSNLSSYIQYSIYQHLVYTLCDSVTKACQLSSMILRESLKHNLTVNLSNAYLGRAFCKARSGETDSTAYYLDLSEEWRSKTPKVEASPGYYNQMYKVSMIIKDYDRALRYLEIKADQQNQINRINKAAELSDARANFDYLLQKARIGELQAEKTVAEERAKRRKLTIMGIAALLLISITTLLNTRKQYRQLGLSYRSLVKKHVELDELNSKLLQGNGNNNKRSSYHIKDEEKILELLKKKLSEDKIFKQTDLSLHSFAEILDTNTSYLSTIINNHFSVNFKGLINKYRIDEARKLLISDNTSNYSIEGIALEVGFQSRSVFYQTFRQITGMTPTAYVKTYKSLS